MLFNTSLDTICMASIIRVSSIFPNHKIWLKGDFIQPHNIISERSDRVANYILNREIANNKIDVSTLLIIPIDSITKISLVKIGVLKGFQVLAITPENLSKRYVEILTSSGADIFYTPSSKGIRGSLEETDRILNTNHATWSPNYHKETVLIETLTHEIRRDFPQGIDYAIIPTHSQIRINYFAFIIKKLFPHTKVFMTSTNNQLTSQQRFHKPTNLKYVDGIIIADKERSIHIASLIPIKEGLPNNITSGISFSAVEKLIMQHNIPHEKNIITFQTEL